MHTTNGPGSFVWGSCGFPENSHDAVIIHSTNLWNVIQEGFILTIGKAVEKITVLPLTVGDPALPLCSW